MVHVEVDTSPISVETRWNKESKSRAEVYLYDTLIWEGPYESWYSGPDEDEIKQQWDDYFQQFQVEQFKEWLKTNGPRTQAEE